MKSDTEKPTSSSSASSIHTFSEASELSEIRNFLEYDHLTLPTSFEIIQGKRRSNSNDRDIPFNRSLYFIPPITQNNSELSRNLISDVPRNVFKQKSRPIGAGKVCEYKIIFTTAEVNGAGTNSSVLLKLKGSYCSTAPIHLNKKQGASGTWASSSVFLSGLSKQCIVRCADVGELRSIVIENRGVHPEDGLLLATVQVIHIPTKRRWIFNIQKWLSLYHGDGSTIGEFFGMRTSLTTYELTTYNTNFPGAGAESRIFVSLIGKWGVTPRYELVTSYSQESFEYGTVITFRLRAPRLGGLTHIRLYRDTNGLMSDWYLEKVVVSDLTQPTVQYIFNCGDWLGGGRSTPRGNKTFALAEIKNGHNGVSSDLNEHGYRYRLWLYTGNIKGAGTTADVFVQLADGEKTAGEHWFRGNRHGGPSAGNEEKQFYNFSEGSVVEAEVNCSQPLNPLVRLRVGHNNRGHSPDWFLEKVIVEDLDRDQTYAFPCNQWLSDSRDDGLLVRDLHIGSSNAMAPEDVSKSHDFEVELLTRRGAAMGTPKTLLLKLYGLPSRNAHSMTKEDNASPFIRIAGKSIKFEHINLFKFNIPNHEELIPCFKLGIGQSDGDTNKDWMLEKVILRHVQSGTIQMFNCHQWLPFEETDPSSSLKITEYSAEEPTGGTNSSVSSITTEDEQIPWRVEVYTSERPNAGTTARVTIVLYGSAGKSEEVTLTDEPTARDRRRNFKTGSCVYFTVKTPQVGQPYKLRIGRDNRGLASCWHLEKVVLTNLLDGKCYYFPCSQWISGDADGGIIYRELPASGSNIPNPPQLCHYKVRIHTGDRADAGTDARVFLNIFGEMGDTGDRQLKNSSKNIKKFAHGKVDEFIIEAVHLGEIQKIRIGHDGKGAHPGWFLHKVTIEELENPQNSLTFLCDCWLDTKRGDGMIVRQFTRNSQITNTTYRLTILTGVMRNCGTSATVYAQVYGENGDTGPIQLKNAKSSCQTFQPGQTDTFHIDSTDLYEVKKIRLWHDNVGISPDWFVQEVTLLVPEAGLLYTFPVGKWLSKSKPGSDVGLECYPLSVQNVEKAVPYEVTVYTGDIAHAGTEAGVYIKIIGENPRLETEILHFPRRIGAFRRGCIEKFKLYAAEVGRISKVRIGHDGAGPSSSWFLERLQIRKFKTHNCSLCCSPLCYLTKQIPGELERSIEDTKAASACRSGHCACELTTLDDTCSKRTIANYELEEYCFLANKWLALNEGDGQLFKDLLPTTETSNATLTEKPTPYTVKVKTTSSLKGGTNADLFLTLVGEKSESGEFYLHRSNSQRKLLTNDAEEIFSVFARNLGRLKGIRLRQGNGGTESTWDVEEVNVCEETLGFYEEYCFCCRPSPSLSNETLGLVHEFPVSNKNDNSTLKPGELTNTYVINIISGHGRNTAPTGEIYVILTGEFGSSGRLPLHPRPNMLHGTEGYRFNSSNLGPLKKLRLGVEKHFRDTSWAIDEVNVEDYELGKVWRFPCDQWLKSDNINSQTFIDLYPVTEPSKTPKITYEFKIFNSISSDAPTGVRISVELTNREGRKTSRALLPRTVLQGEAEPVYVHLEDIGAFLKSLIIGYDSQGRSTSCHLERVEVKRLSPEDKNPPIYRFDCGRWLTGNEMGKPIETELFLAGSFPDLSRERGHSLRLGLVRPEQSPVSRKKSVYTYEVTVVTADSSPKNANAAIFLSLIDESGRFVERKLEKSETNRKKFESGKADIFVFEDVDLEHISEVRVRQDKSEKTRNWFLDRIEVRGIRSKDGTLPPEIGTRVFKCNKSFSKAEDTISLTPEPNPPEKTPISSLLRDNSRVPEVNFCLPHVPMDSQIALGSHRPYSADTDALADTKLPTVFCRGHAAHQSIRYAQYRIAMGAGNWGRTGARGPVTVNILGTNGTSTGPLLLETLTNNTALEAESEKTFVYRAPRVPFPTEIEIRNLEAGRTKSPLFLRNVRLEILDSGRVYNVPCNAWIAGQDATEGTSICRFPLEYAAINVRPKASSAANSTSLPDKRDLEPAVGIPYRLDVWSDTVIYQSPTVSVEVQLFGDRGNSELILLRQSSWVTTSDERASVHFRGADVGEVKSVRLELIKTITAMDKPDVRISRACLFKTETHEAVELSFTQWHTNNFVNLQHQWADLLASESTKALTATKKYLVRVKTSSLSPESMTANAYIRLYGKNGDTGDLALRAYAANPETFKSGQESKFSFSALPDLGDLMRCTLWHDNAGASPDWHCEWVRVSEVLPPISGLLPREWLFDCNRWISAKQGNNECCVELNSSTSTIFDPLSARTPGEEVVKEMKAARALREEACEESCKSFDTIYRIHVETTNTEGADCDHTGWIMLKGEFGHSAPFYLIHPKGEKTFQRGASDDFIMFSPSLGLLKKLYVGITNYGITLSLDNPNDPSQQQQKDLQWHCKRILVTDEKNGNVYVFNINQWIMVHPDVGKHAGFKAKPAELRTEPIDRRERNVNGCPSKVEQVTYKITLLTGAEDDAGTTANIYIRLLDDKSGTESGFRPLPRSSKNTFACESKNVFNVTSVKLKNIDRIFIEHDISGHSPDWYLAKAIVVEVESSRMWSFACYDWISLTRGQRTLPAELLSY